MKNCLGFKRAAFDALLLNSKREKLKKAPAARCRLKYDLCSSDERQ